jgi:SAM-dependent methyltransferase
VERKLAGHADRVQRSFLRQAVAFEEPRFNRPFATGMEWLFEPLRLATDDLMLDVAAGTGQAARALAPSVRSVIALDATDAMLAEGRAAAEKAGLRNIVFQRGDALALPFLDASFDVVVCRFAAHHFEAPAVLIAEMLRCVRPGGQVALADLIADPDPRIAGTQNELERLRDPSHTRMLARDELAALVGDAGLTVQTVAQREHRRPLEPWLEQAGATAAAASDIRARLRRELAGGPVTGLGPAEAGGELWFSQAVASVIAVRSG